MSYQYFDVRPRPFGGRTTKGWLRHGLHSVKMGFRCPAETDADVRGVTTFAAGRTNGMRFCSSSCRVRTAGSRLVLS